MTTRQQQRLEIAISLLQGHVVQAPEGGYDPMNFHHKRVYSLAKSALDMADAVLELNEEYGQPPKDVGLNEFSEVEGPEV